MAISLKDDDIAAFEWRGLAYTMISDFDRAIENFDAVIQVNPGNSYAIYFRGLVYSYNGDRENAARDFLKASTLNPFNEAFKKRAKEFNR